MSNEFNEIIEALEKPLSFASKNGFSNINKVKDLDRLVTDLTLKAQSLPISSLESADIKKLKDLFSSYDTLGMKERKGVIRESLKILRSLKNRKTSAWSGEPVEKALRKTEAIRGGDSLTSEENREHSHPGHGSLPGDIPIQFIKGVGPRLASILKKKGIENVEDALYSFPRTYEDRRTVKKISQLKPGLRETVTGRIILSGRIRAGRRSLYQIMVSDGTGTLTLIWFRFNEEYLRNAYKKGASLILTGEVGVGYRGELQIVHPKPEDIEVIEEGEDLDEDHLHFNRIVPIYPLTEGLRQRRMRRIMKSVVDGYAGGLSSSLPGTIKNKRGLLDLNASVSRVHFPANDDRVVNLSDKDSVYSSLPHRSLSYYEFFLMEIGLALKKRDVAELEGIAFSPTGELTGKLISGLPFRLTSAQERVLSEIESDMRSGRPMNRLLQGDVGSGKTIVSLLSMLKAVESGYQAVLMAPTEILAEQHLASVLSYVKGMGLRVVFLKSGLGRGEKNAYYKAIASGEAQIAVGTHALLQEKVDFRKLGLVVIDEQHRFGVMQRAKLMEKGANPHVLVMTATPIPRTLALTVYGDLDLSVLDELPPGRKEIKTKIYYDHKGSRERAYEAVRKELAKGRQAYVVYPMIEESDNPDFKD
ncbi:MAG TPA: ATP-dependent DNA helicase RecG, partial [Thermodesulfobacteriota bacterium]|nr:ATP-dependent DNA helicase RecG [Thermodesulfobacteriota bacterium]